jgi:hypothetical protein
MAYNRENKLKIIKDVQELYRKHKVPGVTTVHVFKTYIKPKYHITIQTLYTYLATPAVNELKKIIEKKEQKALQLKLTL